MFARPGVVVATWLMLLAGGLAEEAGAACVSLGTAQHPSTAHLLQAASASISRQDETAVLLWSLYFHQLSREKPGQLAEWWISSVDGMSQPLPHGGEGGAPQVCALAYVPEGTSLSVVARLALQEQTSLPPPLSSRLFRPPRTGNC